MTVSPALEPLKIADPETYAWVKDRVALIDPPPEPDALALLVEATIWALCVETGLGHTVADGLLKLMASGLASKAPGYIRQIRSAAETGATLARILARHLPPVLLAGDHLQDPFSRTIAIMLGKGTYTLNMPLELLDEVLASGDLQAAEAYLELLALVFRQPITYNQSNRLVQHLPLAIRAFPCRRRAAQIGELARVAQIDLHLADAFIEGMSKGLEMLPPQNLAAFVDQALTRYRRNTASGLNYLSLNAKLGQDACSALQVAAALPGQKSGLNRYLRARLGRPVAIFSMRAPGPAAVAPAALSCSDSRSIYLREEIDHFTALADNRALYKTLTRLEAGLFESRSFDFDLERAADLYPEIAQWLRTHPPGPETAAICDADRFLQTFPRMALADDLLAVFELARVTGVMAARYPGLMRRIEPVLAQEALLLRTLEEPPHPLRPLYERLVLRTPDPSPVCSPVDPVLAQAAALFLESVEPASPVELCARFTCRAYSALKDWIEKTQGTCTALTFPFGHRPYWRLVSMAQAEQAATVLKLKAQLLRQGLPLYRADLYNELVQKKGRLSAQDIAALVLARQPEATPEATPVRQVFDLNGTDWRALLASAEIALSPEPSAHGKAFHYPEWDHRLQDYLKAHVRVQESAVATAGGDAFYTDTLARRRGLITHMRRAFELLKPEKVAILRQWPEGDDFDYRALLDFAIDRRLGRIPSDRLFIKRLKQERSVAVLLLVDVSRSTANPVAGGHTSVLEVAKEALVLFCEALQVVGDDYAIAGFSGTGRHSVDYFPVKNFEEPLNLAVRQRISALTPQRSTRMGAAIRHAAAQMGRVAARVRLIILVSDGFPNDVGYKSDYAIADTRRAVQEARAQQVHVKAITVNIGSSPGLDELYGRHHHRVIDDVRELPGRLLRLYGTLTRTY